MNRFKKKKKIKTMKKITCVHTVSTCSIYVKIWNKIVSRFILFFFVMFGIAMKWLCHSYWVGSKPNQSKHNNKKKRETKQYHCSMRVTLLWNIVFKRRWNNNHKIYTSMFQNGNLKRKSERNGDDNRPFAMFIFWVKKNKTSKPDSYGIT